MDVQQLKARIEGGENLTTEFKLDAVQADDLAAAIVAFANSAGGDLILGVADDKTVRGVKAPDRLAQIIENVALQNCIPAVPVSVQHLETPEGVVTLVNVPRGPERPYRTNRGVYYVRTSAGRRAATREEIMRLFHASENYFYDETVLLRLSSDEIDQGAFRRFLMESFPYERIENMSVDRLLHSWRLRSADGHPTIAGLLLFGFDVQSHLPYAQINALRIRGTDIADDPLDRKDLRGTVFHQITQAMDFCNLYLPTPHVIKALEPEAKPELPLEALRELIVNAVVHRDYTIHGPVRLLIFDDRIEIRSPGQPPNSIDVDAMLDGAHVVRNPHVFARLSDCGLITGAGSGIRRARRLIQGATGKDLDLRITSAEVVATIPRRTPIPV